MEKAKEDHQLRTRNLRPVQYVTFTGHEMIAGILSELNPDDVMSLNQLHGDKRGVVRISMKSEKAAKKLDQKVCDRKLSIRGVKVGQVAQTGQFVQVTLLDVPEYLSDDQVENFMTYYGSVVNVRREYFEYENRKIENETRHLFFESIKRNFPSKLSMFGHDVFISYRNIVKPTAIRSIPRSASRHREESFRPPDTEQQLGDNNSNISHHDRGSNRSVSPVKSASSRLEPTTSASSPRHTVQSGNSNNVRTSMAPNTASSPRHTSAFWQHETKVTEKETVPNRRKEVSDSPQQMSRSKERKSKQVTSDKNHKYYARDVSPNQHKKDRRKNSDEEQLRAQSKRQTLKRTDTIEKIGSGREKEEKLALNIALESMCNPLHSFECSGFSIKSADGMSYGYGRLEVNTSTREDPPKIERKRERADREQLDPNKPHQTAKEKMASPRKENEKRSVTPDGRVNENKLGVVSPDHWKTRSLTTSPHPDEPRSLVKKKKSLSTRDDDEIIAKNEDKDTNKDHRVDFISSSLPASFSDPGSRGCNRKYKDDLVRSLTATPLSITGHENRIDLNYFSSRQWFASDKTGQLSMSVRSVRSESQSSEAAPGDHQGDTVNRKEVVDGVEVAGNPYRHPDEVKCTDTYVERLFNPGEKKKKVRLRDTRAKARIKKDFCLFTS